MVNKDLYTTSDIKKERKRLHDQQNGIDPILKEPVKFDDTVCDHDHTSQHTRAALHRQVNAFEGKVTNAYTRYLKWLTDIPLPDILRNLADYLELDHSNNPHHPAWIKRVTTDFRKLGVKAQQSVLNGLDVQDVPTNSLTRCKAFQARLKTKKYNYEFVRDLIKGA